MQKTYRFEISVRALCAVTMVSLVAGGCSYVDGQLRELESTASKEQRQPSVRTARAEPNVMRSAPRRTAEEPGAAHGDRSRTVPPQLATPAGGVKSPVQPETVSPAPAPVAAPSRAAPPPVPPPAAAPAHVQPVPATPPSPQPRIINPSVPATPPPVQEAPAQPPSDPLPTQPAPPPARPDAVPAPPNRANVTTPRQAGGGIVSARPPAGEESSEPRELAALPPARAAAPPAGTPGMNGIELARQLLSKGKVLEARTHLQSAVRVSPALALLELARTYDPFYLGMLPSIDDGSEPRRAAALYQEAIVHGSPTAGADLDRLRQMHPGLR